jgi:hypothetical protein
VNEIALPLRGGCLCGACRYELRARPFMVYLCHCRDCQRQSGSAFTLSMPAPRDAFEFVSGDPARFPRVLPSGRTAVVRFCGVCATRLCGESSPTVVTVRAGTLDDTSWLRPAAQNWTRSALPWACVAEVPGHETNPASYEEIGRAWTALGIRFAKPA